MRRRRVVVLVGLAVALSLQASACSSGHETKPATSYQLVQTGLAALQQGKQDVAFSAFSAAANKDPKNFYAHYNLGTIYQQQGKTTEALEEYGLALHINPNYVPALFNEATIYGGTNSSLAIVTYRQVISLQPKAPTAYLNLGLLEAKLEMFDQAAKDLQTALNQDPALVTSIPKDVFAKRPTPKPTSK